MHLSPRLVADGCTWPSIRCQRFQALWPDRGRSARAHRLARAEAIDTIDVYAGSPLAYTFPDRVEFTQLLPPGIEAVEFLPAAATTWPPAVRC